MQPSALVRVPSVVMSPAAGPFMIAALLVALGGAAKAARPADTANALRGVGVPARPWSVRLGGGLELLIGTYALVVGDRLGAALVAASYLLFAGFVTVALVRRAPIATCGCFGKADSPPSVLHLVLDLGAVVAALAVMADPGVGVGDVLAEQPLAGIPYLLLVATGTGLAYVGLTSLPRVLALARPEVT